MTLLSLAHKLNRVVTRAAVAKVLVFSLCAFTVYSGSAIQHFVETFAIPPGTIAFGAPDAGAVGDANFTKDVYDGGCGLVLAAADGGLWFANCAGATTQTGPAIMVDLTLTDPVNASITGAPSLGIGWPSVSVRSDSSGVVETTWLSPFVLDGTLFQGAISDAFEIIEPDAGVVTFTFNRDPENSQVMWLQPNYGQFSPINHGICVDLNGLGQAAGACLNFDGTASGFPATVPSDFVTAAQVCPNVQPDGGGCLGSVPSGAVAFGSPDGGGVVGNSALTTDGFGDFGGGTSSGVFLVANLNTFDTNIRLVDGIIDSSVNTTYPDAGQSPITELTLRTINKAGTNNRAQFTAQAPLGGDGGIFWEWAQRNSDGTTQPPFGTVSEFGNLTLSGTVTGAPASVPSDYVTAAQVCPNVQPDGGGCSTGSGPLGVPSGDVAIGAVDGGVYGTAALDFGNTTANFLSTSASTAAATGMGATNSNASGAAYFSATNNLVDNFTLAMGGSTYASSNVSVADRGFLLASGANGMSLINSGGGDWRFYNGVTRGDFTRVLNAGRWLYGTFGNLPIDDGTSLLQLNGNINTYNGGEYLTGDATAVPASGVSLRANAVHPLDAVPLQQLNAQLTGFRTITYGGSNVTASLVTSNLGGAVPWILGGKVTAICYVVTTNGGAGSFALGSIDGTAGTTCATSSLDCAAATNGCLYAADAGLTGTGCTISSAGDVTAARITSSTCTATNPILQATVTGNY